MKALGFSNAYALVSLVWDYRYPDLMSQRAFVPKQFRPPLIDASTETKQWRRGPLRPSWIE